MKLFAAAIPFLLCLVFALTMICGWVLNIVDLIHLTAGPVTAMFVLRIVGVFAAPLGSVLGLFF